MMPLYTLFALLLLSSSSTVQADGNADAVNERIPVRSAELEQHWQVDCDSTWRDLLHGAQQSTDGSCVLPAALEGQLRLCSFIYQAPGDEQVHTCPDYRGASTILQRPGPPGICTRLAKFIDSLESCLSPEQTNSSRQG